MHYKHTNRTNTNATKTVAKVTTLNTVYSNLTVQLSLAILLALSLLSLLLPLGR